MIVIPIANHKGGVGKTTTTFNLGWALADAGKRTLVIDLDPQGSLTAAAGLDKHNLTSGSFTLLDTGVAEVFNQGNLSIIPTNSNLAAITPKLSVNTRLKKALKQFESQFDFVLVDSPPNLDTLTINALSAARWVIVPCQCQFLALDGLTEFLNTVEDVKEGNPQLEIFAVLPTLYTPRRTHEQEALELLQEKFGAKCEAPIPDRAEYPRSMSDHRPVNGDLFPYWQKLAAKIISQSEEAS